LKFQAWQSPLPSLCACCRTQARAFRPESSDVFDFVASECLAYVTGISISVAKKSASGGGGNAQWSLRSVACDFEIESGHGGQLFKFIHASMPPPPPPSCAPPFVPSASRSSCTSAVYCAFRSAAAAAAAGGGGGGCCECIQPRVSFFDAAGGSEAGLGPEESALRRQIPVPSQSREVQPMPSFESHFAPRM
jgi:hypothetical protein